MEISSQTALVTGGGSGLGAATARHLAGHGAKVAVLDYDRAKADTVASEIGGIAVQADVGETASVEAGLGEVVTKTGMTPRIIINCAGIGLAASSNTMQRTQRSTMLAFPLAILPGSGFANRTS